MHPPVFTCQGASDVKISLMRAGKPLESLTWGFVPWWDMPCRAALPRYLPAMTQPDTRVLYNHDCPICRAEITHYASYAGREGLAIGFDDLNRVDLGMWGVTADQAARRLHVIHEGRVLSGLPAFITLWRHMPRYRWLARVVALPGIRQAATLVYDRVLAPLLYRSHLRRQRRG